MSRKPLTKKRLLKLLENVGDNDVIQVVTHNYKPNNDFTWGIDNETTIVRVNKFGMLVLDVNEFS